MFPKFLNSQFLMIPLLIITVLINFSNDKSERVDFQSNVILPKRLNGHATISRIKNFFVSDLSLSVVSSDFILINVI